MQTWGGRECGQEFHAFYCTTCHTSIVVYANKYYGAIMTKHKSKMILAAACTNFAEKGFEKTSIEIVAQHAGVALGLVRYYFANKENLYFEAIKATMTGLRDHLELLDLPSKESREAIRAFVLSYMRYTSDPANNYRAIYREPPFAVLADADRMRELGSLSMEIVEVLKQALVLDFEPDTATRMAAYVVTSLHGVQRSRFSPVYHDLFDMNELADFFARALPDRYTQNESKSSQHDATSSYS